MDEPGTSWPHWKFGMKRDDLFSTLQDQYNTLQSSIQDPEAFHHDVYEISTKASTTAEFHSLLAERKQQRLRELNESLESASFEIIANPSLVGTEQWALALQLFRTRSLDSLVRYFASYLPNDHPWNKPWCDSSSVSEIGSSVDSIANSHASLFDLNEGPIMSDDSLSLSTSDPRRPNLHMPPSPRSMTMCSNSSAASPIDELGNDYAVGTLTPARTLSFSESESDLVEVKEYFPSRHETPGQGSCESLSSAEKQDKTSLQCRLGKGLMESKCEQDVQDNSLLETTISPCTELMGSNFATPKLGQPATSFLDAKPSLPQRRWRCVSPSDSHPSNGSSTMHPHIDILKAAGLSRSRRMLVNSCRGRWRSYREPATRIQKSLPEPMRSRPRGYRRVDM